MAFRSIKLLQSIDYLPYKLDLIRYNGDNKVRMLEYVPNSELIHAYVYKRRKYKLEPGTVAVYSVTNKLGIEKIVWQGADGKLVQLLGTPSEDDELHIPYVELRDNSECYYNQELGLFAFYVVKRGFRYVKLPRGRLNIDSNCLIYTSIWLFEFRLYLINNGAELIDAAGNRYKVYSDPNECPVQNWPNVDIFQFNWKLNV